ncbi:hypothetical protein EJB05_06517, partial [Eragrostis curvula]
MWSQYHSSVYWQGRLYLYCECDYAMRISMSDAKYKGAFTPGSYELQIFLLNESCGQTSWVLKHRVDLETFTLNSLLRDRNEQRRVEGPWTLLNLNYCVRAYAFGSEEVEEEEFEWNSDDDDVLDTDDLQNTDTSPEPRIRIGYATDTDTAQIHIQEPSNSPLKADIPLPLFSPLPDLAATQNISRQGDDREEEEHDPLLHICPTAVELAGGDPTTISRARSAGILEVADLSLDEPELEAVPFGDAEVVCPLEVIEDE